MKDCFLCEAPGIVVSRISPIVSRNMTDMDFPINKTEVRACHEHIARVILVVDRMIESPRINLINVN